MWKEGESFNKRKCTPKWQRCAETRRCFPKRTACESTILDWSGSPPSAGPSWLLERPAAPSLSCFTDWLTVISLPENPWHSQWLTKCRKPPTIKLYHSSSPNCHTKAVILSLDSFPGLFVSQDKTKVSPAVDPRKWHQQALSQRLQQQMGMAAEVCWLILNRLQNSYYTSEIWNKHKFSVISF